MQAPRHLTDVRVSTSPAAVLVRHVDFSLPPLFAVLHTMLALDAHRLSRRQYTTRDPHLRPLQIDQGYEAAANEHVCITEGAVLDERCEIGSWT